jgi:hypothetical protein
MKGKKMGLIDSITHRPLQAFAAHSAVECTFDLVTLDDGTKCLQLDTYGSTRRQIAGKKSQTLRFTPAAIATLKSIIAEHSL